MKLNKEWSLFLEKELKSNTYINLEKFIINEYKIKTIFPIYENIFRAFNLLIPSKVKVVIIGQDPYYGENQANGLAFSVYDECKIPPSLKNIFKELVTDMNCTFPKNGNLEKWSKDGILLINSVLTVQEGKPNSHKNIAWEIFTDAVIKKLSFDYENIVFILWGSYAGKKSLLINEKKHLILKAPHPSPLSSYRGFFGSKPFSQANSYLLRTGQKKIDWCL
ncbi:MAG: uracil-DNA glycosylase [Sulfurimonas sp.]|nr:uracil-DNA glycosylase [Sulfurimonas sp.]MDQ7061537.1 uracil-DNA glycosylase [Sulfurimonas sp.]